MGTDLRVLIGDVDMDEIRPHYMEKAIKISEKEDLNFIGSNEFYQLANHLIDQYFARSRKSSENTIRRLKQGWKTFDTWCADNNLASLPAKASTLEKFFIDVSEKYHRNTLTSLNWAIGKYHQISGCPNPCQDVYFKQTLDGLVKDKVLAQEPINQAPPFNGKHLNAILAKYKNFWKANTLIKRNICLLTMAYESMLRSAELARVQIKHIQWQEDGTAVLVIPFTKTNRTGNHDEALLTFECTELIRSYMACYTDWSPENYLFRPLTRHSTERSFRTASGNVKNILPITTKAIEGIYAWATNFLVKEGFIEPSVKLQTHSARVGAAQDLMKNGCTIPQIQQAGRWSSVTMVNRYCQGIRAKESAMTQMRQNFHNH